MSSGIPMTSEAKLAANRLNARKSRGPKTAEGKARSSANAISHGLTVKHFVADGESAADFERLSKSVLAQFPPKNEIQRHKVHRLIELYWNVERARTLETLALSAFLKPDDVGFLSVQSYKSETLRKIGGLFELLDKIYGYTARMSREIDRIEDDLTSNRLLQEEIIVDGQSEEIASERMTEPS